jgi:hypothetical protein
MLWKEVAKRTSKKGEKIVYSLPELKAKIAKEFPEYKLVKRKGYAGAPADKTRVSK